MGNMVENVKFKKEIVAIILRKGYRKKGARFFTGVQDPLQFGVLHYKKGEEILAHKHLTAKRSISLAYEALFVQSGKLEVTFYNEKNKKIAKKILNPGDTILLMKLGHGFKVLKAAKIIEIKQGPYLGKEKDKEYLRI